MEEERKSDQGPMPLMKKCGASQGTSLGRGSAPNGRLLVWVQVQGCSPQLCYLLGLRGL